MLTVICRQNILRSITIKEVLILVIIMLSVNFLCNINSYDILAYITKNYIALIYYAKMVHLLCQFGIGQIRKIFVLDWFIAVLAQ
jgi:hypothetical protein